MSVTKCFSIFFSRNTGTNKTLVPPGIKNIIHIVYLEDPGLRIFCWLATLKSSNLPAKQQRCGKLKFRSFFNLTNLTLCALNIHCTAFNIL